MEGEWETPSLDDVNQTDDGASSQLCLEGRIRDVTIKHEFLVAKKEPLIEERLTLHNGGSKSVDTSGAAMGFARSMGSGGEIDGDLLGCRVTAIPFRRALFGSVIISQLV